MQTKLVLKDDVINGFSFSFSSALLKELKKLVTNNQCIISKNSTCIHADVLFYKYTPIDSSIISYLSKQVNLDIDSDEGTNKIIEDFIKHTEDFLDIFIEK
ncbi:hypothetical protein ACFL2L_01440 [Patescibacteria group bacterium]